MWRSEDEPKSSKKRARQKLARLTAREFATLLIDVLSEAKRRHLGTKQPVSEDQRLSDDEPLYDSVASDEDNHISRQLWQRMNDLQREHAAMRLDLEAMQATLAEFTRLQLEELPAEVLKEQQIDEQWRVVSSLRELDGSLKYARLSKFMLGVLTLPHSNAECERVFSKVKKVHTQFRASMSKKTLEQLLVARCAQSHSGKCHEQVFDKDFLRKAKAATASMLAHPSTSET
ncbi:hypothetical protein HPB52_004556 [Rhipicephalus sanguineus]|uniref:GIT Spa2 homology (SHD) domain-containing protein n=1 Tax=Rhipicephalus sanguineus TaxID=34632 RepID=A0A9D4PUJ1_RHISA|nr:hypothetical protein HPB52_004556 [Rhipicephalus sanguineus]